MNNLELMKRLCAMFPGLRGVPGTDPWDALEILQWLLDTGSPTGGSSCAARFVLQVWDWAEDWRAVAKKEGIRGWRHFAPFNAVEALSRWDADHAAAFAQWVNFPFFP
jgi:hypothetical protein